MRTDLALWHHPTAAEIDKPLLPLQAASRTGDIDDSIRVPASLVTVFNDSTSYQSRRQHFNHSLSECP